MSFGKYMTAFLGMLLISRLTFLQHEFFDYRLFENTVSVGKLVVELLLYGLVFWLIYFAVNRFQDWRMQAKHQKLHRQADK